MLNKCLRPEDGCVWGSGAWETRWEDRGIHYVNHHVNHCCRDFKVCNHRKNSCCDLVFLSHPTCPANTLPPFTPDLLPVFVWFLTCHFDLRPALQFIAWLWHLQIKGLWKLFWNLAVGQNLSDILQNYWPALKKKKNPCHGRPAKWLPNCSSLQETRG